MKVKLLDENTYGIFDDADTEVGKGSITAEMRSRVRKNKTLSKVVKEAVEAELGKAVDDIPAELVQTAEPVTVPYHEHDADDRYAPAEHVHDYQPIGTITPHKHDAFQVLGAALEGLQKLVQHENEEFSKLLTSHKHMDYAAQFHLHADINENLNLLSRQIAEVRALIPAEAPAHQHNDTADAISILRSEITSLRQALDFERGKRAEDADRVQSYVQAQIEASRPDLSVYATKDELNSISLRSGRFQLRMLSDQVVNGKKVWTVEEVT